MAGISTNPFTVSQLMREQFARLRESCAAWFQGRPGQVPEPAWDYTPWQAFWGAPYGLDLKRWLLKPVFERLEAEGKVGDVIVDIGSGAQPVTQFLPKRSGRKRICVDVAGDNRSVGDMQTLRLDVEKVAEPGSMSVRKALLRACRFLEMAPDEASGEQRADLMVCADLLNYVDFRKVLGGFSRYLKPGGRLVVVNLPMRGNQELFSEKGLKDNRLLCEYLEEQRFEIEHKAFPCRPKGTTDEADELIVLVARKAA
jgi:SAM-dependent methyltransferase